MAITPEGHRALEAYIANAQRFGRPDRINIGQAVTLTDSQVEALTRILTEYWGRPYECPKVLDIKPHHGYLSRVNKDNYPPDQYVLWLVAGCSDVATVEVEEANGRPRLVISNVCDHHSKSYSLIVPVRSDTHGHVHIDDVIPKGLPPRQKKTAPSAIP